MSRYWLSFDLCLRGNYDKLYQWLDSAEAVECGDFLATFNATKSLEELTGELSSLVDENARLYLINPPKGGIFIKGGRKRAPWAGYSVKNQNIQDI